MPNTTFFYLLQQQTTCVSLLLCDQSNGGVTEKNGSYFYFPFPFRRDFCALNFGFFLGAVARKTEREMEGVASSAAVASAVSSCKAASISSVVPALLRSVLS
mmetsp:Transcript_3984/g.10871  ORF Transcript_3984/g.10871 Transcript_3984/m.10871 type:complete len:102 (+) Transcript_3984:787-1092(+)